MCTDWQKFNVCVTMIDGIVLHKEFNANLSLWDKQPLMNKD